MIIFIENPSGNLEEYSMDSIKIIYNFYNIFFFY